MIIKSRGFGSSLREGMDREKKKSDVTGPAGASVYNIPRLPGES